MKDTSDDLSHHDRTLNHGATSRSQEEEEEEEGRRGRRGWGANILTINKQPSKANDSNISQAFIFSSYFAPPPPPPPPPTYVLPNAGWVIKAMESGFR